MQQLDALYQEIQAHEFLGFLKNPKNLALYGAGRKCEWWLENAREYHLPIEVIVDAEKTGDLMGIPVVRKEDFFDSKSSYKKYKFIITTMFYAYPVGIELIERGISREDIYIPNRQCLINGIGMSDFVYAHMYFTILDMIVHREHYYHVYGQLQDEQSKKVFLAILRYRVFGTYEIDKGLYLKDPSYFQNDNIKFGNSESFVDIGAYNGDSIVDFLMKTKRKYHKIYAVEGNEKRCEEIKKKLYMECDTKGLEVLHVGAGKKRETICYNGYRGGIGAEKLEVYALDELFRGKRVSLIKMDIEGMELDAIEGAKGIITEQKPKLAICVYHLVKDIWEIQERLSLMVPEYKFWLDQPVNENMTETVLYASVD